VGNRKATLFEAVERLDEIIDIVSTNSAGCGSTRLVLVRLLRLRRILEGEVKQPQPSWTLVAILVREAARLLGDLISTIRWLLHPLVGGDRGIGVGTRVRSEIFSA